MRRLQPWLLPSVVFLTGASVLIIEVLAVRVLAPYYGNTIFTVSSVISVVLLALSAGYYAGGALADRRPSLLWFFGLILVSGIVLLAFQAAGALLLPRFSAAFSLQTGPLVSSAFLFLLPALLLGMLSPYAVKLQSASVPTRGVGRVAGEIFFWSTLGSITGSLLAGFVLIPRFGIDRILIATGLLLLALGGVPLIVLRARRTTLVAGAGAAVLALGMVAFAETRPGDTFLYRRDGVYQRVTIYEGEQLGRPARFLLLDRSESGAMFLDTADSTDLAYDYTKYYALYKIFTPDVRRALVLGGGAYSIPKALLQELPDAEIDVAEIEPSLFGLAKQYFKVVDDPRLHNHVEDGRRFLQDVSTPYDLIFGDVYYSYFSVPPHFTTREFFALARHRLAPGGVFIANMIGDLSRRQPSLILAELKTFQAVFPNSYFFAVESPEKTGLIQNITLVGYNSDRHVDVRSPQVTRHPSPLIRFLQYKAVDVERRYELSPYPVLTDTYAPVEYLTARVLERSLASSLDINGDEMAAVTAQERRYVAGETAVRAREKVRNFLLAETQVLAQEVVTQVFAGSSRVPEPDRRMNIIARLHDAEKRRVIVAAHYAGPIGSPGGPALLLEVARALIAAADAPRFGIDVVLLDDGGGGWLVDHFPDVYGTEGPSAALIVDDACHGAIDVLDGPARLRDRDAMRGAQGPDRRGDCTASDLETAAKRTLAYLNGIR
jgi:spermidine synthase